MTSVAEWIGGRTPPSPEAFVPWLASAADVAAEPASALAREALASLGEALDRPGRDREGALHLLAADGYLTYACEAAAEVEDVGVTLRRLLERVAVIGG